MISSLEISKKDGNKGCQFIFALDTYCKTYIISLISITIFQHTADTV